MVIHIILFFVGLSMLYFGAEWLVKGSSSLAKSLGLTPLMIGLTVVAFGTSAPEMVVSLVSSIKGKSMIAVGNVIGSNICNIALVLGLTALLNPVSTQRAVITRDIPVMLGISLYLMILSFNSTIGRLEGVSLFTGIIAYSIFNYYCAMRFLKTGGNSVSAVISEESGESTVVKKRTIHVLLIVSGVATVVIGADTLIDSAVTIMKSFGVSEKFIGLTVVAFGTSLPELATSVVAAMKKEMEISLGNLVGSNVFNILSVLGVAAMVKPIPIAGGFVESGLFIDYIVMMIISFLPLVLMRKDLRLSRMQGGFLLACYAGYITFLLFKS